MAANDHLSAAQFHVKMTPKQHDALNAYRGESEYLNAAEDNGMTITGHTAHLPDAAVEHFGNFVNMRKEIAEDNKSYGEDDYGDYDRAFEGLHKRTSEALGERMPRKFG